MSFTYNLQITRNPCAVNHAISAIVIPFRPVATEVSS